MKPRKYPLAIRIIYRLRKCRLISGQTRTRLTRLYQYRDWEIARARNVSTFQRLVLIKKLGHIACKRCGSTQNLTQDHIIPKARGGSNRMENKQILCARCNLAKGSYIEYSVR